jgi:hypothetical protein
MGFSVVMMQRSVVVMQCFVARRRPTTHTSCGSRQTNCQQKSHRADCSADLCARSPHTLQYKRIFIELQSGNTVQPWNAWQTKSRLASKILDPSLLSVCLVFKTTPIYGMVPPT